MFETFDATGGRAPEEDERIVPGAFGRRSANQRLATAAHPDPTAFHG